MLSTETKKLLTRRKAAYEKIEAEQKLSAERKKAIQKDARQILDRAILPTIADFNTACEAEKFGVWVEFQEEVVEGQEALRFSMTFCDDLGILVKRYDLVVNESMNRGSAEIVEQLKNGRDRGIETLSWHELSAKQFASSLNRVAQAAYSGK